MKRRKCSWEKRTIASLIEKGILLGDPEDDRFILFLAIAENRAGEAIKLLDYVSPNERCDNLSNEDCTFLHQAAAKGLVPLIQAMFERGASANAEAKHGTPLHYAAKNGHDAAFQLIKTHTKRRFHRRGDRLLIDSKHSRESAQAIFSLARAGWECRRATLSKLIHNGVDPNSSCLATGGASALHLAARGGDVEIIKMLIDAGADPNALDYDGLTPLFFVDELAACNALLRAGADPLVVSETKELSIMRAFDPQVFRRLERTGADYTQRDSRGNGAILLMLLCLRMRKGWPIPRALKITPSLDAGLARTVTKLAKAKVDVNDVNVEDGSSPLMIASSLGLTMTVSALLKFGANPNLVDTRGRNAIAYTKRGSDVSKQLREFMQ